MFKIDFKIVLRSLTRRKGFSFINIAGLALGITCAFLILIWVRDELSFDRFHEHSSRIYRVVADWEKNSWDGFEGSPAPLASAAIEQLPEITSAARFASRSRKVFRAGDKSFFEDDGIIVDPSFFKLFTFPFLKGDPDSVFSDESDIVMTETMAKRYFGEKEPLGEVIEIDGRIGRVTGILRDIPSNSHLKFDYAQSFEFIEQLEGYGTFWGAFNFITYVRIPATADSKLAGAKLTDLALSNNCPQVKSGVVFRLQPLTQIHLDSRTYQRPGIVLGDAKYVSLFSLIAFFVLIIACINFMNLSTARSALRAKEVGIRKTVGATRLRIILRFFFESFALACFSGLIALIAVRLALPSFNLLTGKSLSLSLVSGGHFWLLAALVLLTALLAGVYPAVYLSKFHPLSVLKGTYQTGKQGSGLRRSLVVFQFSLSILLIIATLVVSRQLHYMKNKKLAFNQNNIVYVPMKGSMGPGFEAAKQELLGGPGILGVTAQNYLFMETCWRTTGVDWEGRDPDSRRDIIVHSVDIDFFKVMEMELAEGRLFSPARVTDDTEAFIINQEAVRQMGIDPPVGKPFDFARGSNDVMRGRIIGVLKNGHIRSLHNEIEPHIFLLNKDWSESGSYGVVLMKIVSERTSEALSHIRRVWEKINPSIPFEYRFLDQAYDALYRKEQRTGAVFNIFAGLTVMISVLGLFGLASFMAQRRVKEIGIRKVLGASESGLVILLSKQFGRWVLLANLIAWPAAYWASGKWLAQFPYRINIGIWVFLVSGAAALITAWLTVGFQVIRAARANPVDSLRYE